MTWEVSDREIATVTVKGVVIAGKRRARLKFRFQIPKTFCIK